MRKYTIQMYLPGSNEKGVRTLTINADFYKSGQSAITFCERIETECIICEGKGKIVFKNRLGQTKDNPCSHCSGMGIIPSVKNILSINQKEWITVEDATDDD